MIVTKFRFKLWLFIATLYECRKSQYHQVAGEKVINDQNFQFFLFLTTLKCWILFDHVFLVITDNETTEQDKNNKINPK